MKEKTKNMRDIAIQIDVINRKMKNVNQELDYINKINQKLKSDVQKMIEKSNIQNKK